MSKDVLQVHQIKQFEEQLFSVYAFPSLLVMENAARSLMDKICHDHPIPGRCLVLCGKGNNGGDGFALARQLALRGWEMRVIALGDCRHRSENALAMRDALLGSGISVDTALEESQWETWLSSVGQVDVIVDAVFGIGLNRQLYPFYNRVFRDVNEMRGKKYAVDIPSGIDGDSGALYGDAIRADVTVTFFAAKPGQLLYPGREYVGEFYVEKLSLIDAPYEGGIWMQPEDLQTHLPPRRRDAQKGNFGFGLLLGGSAGLTGAVQHAAAAAMRSGIGRLALAVPEMIAPAIWAALPDGMTYPLQSMDALNVEPLLTGKTCLALGPGMGKVPDFKDLLLLLLKSGLPLVVDADGLNGLSENLTLLHERRGEVLLTPHPGEMARLCKRSVADVLQNPVKIAADFARKTGAVVLLKGGTSVIAAPDGRVAYNTSGGPALAKGGSGDILCGIVLAFLGQGLSAFDAACCAALTLGMAAESVDMDEKAVVARDVIDAIPMAFRVSLKKYLNCNESVED